MFPIIAKYESGELSRQECLEQYEMNAAVFWYWLNKYRKDQRSEQPFIQLDFGSSTKTMELIDPNGQVLRFYGYPRLEYLQGLMKSR